MFLKKIKVNKFCKIHKTNNFLKERILFFIENENKNDLFYILRKTTIKEGESEYINDVGYVFNHKKTHNVYVVSNELNKQYFALLEDVIFAENENE